MKPSEPYKPVYKRKRWNILFIGEHGKVVSIKHFKGIVGTLVLLSVIMVAAVVVLTYLYLNEADDVQVLQRDLAGQVDENRAIKREKDRMIARLVILESKLKVRLEGEPSARAEKTPVNGDSHKGFTDESKAVKADLGSAGHEKNVQQTNRAEPDDSSRTVAVPVSVATENLVVCQDPDSDFIRVEFKVINMAAKGTAVSGRAVIVLKKHDMDPAEWIVLPNVPLSDRMPVGKMGVLFRIYNFRTLKFKVKLPALSDQLEYATIYTYTEGGELMMERDYPLEMMGMCP